MRHEKSEKLLRLALELQAARGGLTIGDIQDRFEVSRSTAIRMRNAILRVFASTRVVDSGDGSKRWTLPPGTIDPLIGLTPEELATLDMATSLLRASNMKDHADRLSAIAAKLNAAIKPSVANKLAPDVEALVEAEGLALRPGPRPQINNEHLNRLRDAIKRCVLVTLRYQSKNQSEPISVAVAPYGFIFGHRHYLIGVPKDATEPSHRFYALSRMYEVTLTNTVFVRDETFDLQEFAQRGFGIFQSEPVDVVWRFSPEASATAKEFAFHPTQATDLQADGSLVVRFRASGLVEMAWFLYSWGTQVEVLEPPELREMVLGYQQSWPTLP